MLVIEPLKLAQYYRNGLADMALRVPTAADKSSFAWVARKEIEAGILSPGLLSRLFPARSDPVGTEATEQADEVIPVTVGLLWFARRMEHAVRADKNEYLGLALPAMLSKSGKLCGVSDKPPTIPRVLLKPALHQYSLGALTDHDEFLSTHRYEPDTWRECIRYAKALFDEVAGSPQHRDDGWILQERPGPVSISTADDTSSPAAKIISLYDHLLESQCAPSILATLANGALPATSTVCPIRNGRRVIATTSMKHGLASSQREAVIHALLAKPGEVVAVNGPPGTGKTSMLSAVLASVWTSAAVDGSEMPPLFVVASTNNRAVRNVCDSMRDVITNHPRWIPDVSELGLYLTNNSEQASGYQNESLFKRIENTDWLLKAVGEYQSKASQRFIGEIAADASPNDIVSVILEKLRNEKARADFKSAVIEKLVDSGMGPNETVSGYRDRCINSAKTERASRLESLNDQRRQISRRICEIQREMEKLERVKNDAAREIGDLDEIDDAWTKHQAESPSWLAVLSIVPGVRTKLKARDAMFWREHGRELSESTLRQKKAKEVRRRKEAAKTLESRRRELHDFGIKHDGILAKFRDEKEEQRKRSETITEITLQAKSFGWATYTLQQCLEEVEKQTRSAIFGLTMHYWEGRYLSFLDGLLRKSNGGPVRDSRSAWGVEARLRRFAMLTPCIVSTLHKLPASFKGWKGETEYCLESIDYLVIDEAGQVSPEVIYGPAALAKRLLVVGDVMQLEPIWGLQAEIDQANARSYLGASSSTLEEYDRAGILVSSGCAMKMAQSACRYETRGVRGFLLREHYRCIPSVIEFCNDLVYSGQLIPIRKDDKSGVADFLPPIGWAKVGGPCLERGSSRYNPGEAEAIANWVSRNKEDLTRGYGGLGLSDVVAIVTPFSPQKEELLRAFNRELGEEHGITIGTVHSLQGAERPVVIFSPVYDRESGWRSEMFFDKSTSFLNVAVSRAKDSFLVFGNVEIFDPRSHTPSGILARRLFERPDNEVKDVHVAQRGMAGSTPSEDLERISGTVMHQDLILRLFRGAMRSICIFSPYASKDVVNNGEIMKEIAGATARGVRVVVILDKQNLNAKDGWSAGLEARSRLESAGASVHLAGLRFHNKSFACDDAVLVEGSFNWLSSPRRLGRRKHECSFVYRGAGVGEMIMDLYSEMSGLELDPGCDDLVVSSPVIDNL